MNATLYSTTGTAPITFTSVGEADLVRIDTEDGSGQVYHHADVIAALTNAGILTSDGHEVPC
ncbi:hypothetical protein [Zhihengliuella halotolerans]|uniref:hypothetical protein n=1 Tax=Zhihengliuella halotolerans TaxID=370736 RepID=UPI000C80F866|nr:hypothetical protein [Zhihengliuella halotolerans]